jgi:hypothetical protein
LHAVDFGTVAFIHCCPGACYPGAWLGSCYISCAFLPRLSSCCYTWATWCLSLEEFCSRWVGNALPLLPLSSVLLSSCFGPVPVSLFCTFAVLLRLVRWNHALLCHYSERGTWNLTFIFFRTYAPTTMRTVLYCLCISSFLLYSCSSFILLLPSITICHCILLACFLHVFIVGCAFLLYGISLLLMATPSSHCSIIHTMPCGQNVTDFIPLYLEPS